MISCSEHLVHRTNSNLDGVAGPKLSQFVALGRVLSDVRSEASKRGSHAWYGAYMFRKGKMEERNVHVEGGTPRKGDRGGGRVLSNVTDQLAVSHQHDIYAAGNIPISNDARRPPNCLAEPANTTSTLFAVPAVSEKKVQQQKLPCGGHVRGILYNSLAKKNRFLEIYCDTQLGSNLASLPGYYCIRLNHQVKPNPCSERKGGVDSGEPAPK